MDSTKTNHPESIPKGVSMVKELTRLYYWNTEEPSISVYIHFTSLSTCIYIYTSLYIYIYTHHYTCIYKIDYNRITIASWCFPEWLVLRRSIATPGSSFLNGGAARLENKAGVVGSTNEPFTIPQISIKRWYPGNVGSWLVCGPPPSLNYIWTLFKVENEKISSQKKNIPSIK